MKQIELFGKKYPYIISISVLKAWTEELSEENAKESDMVALAVDVLHRALKAGQADRPFWKRNIPSKKKLENGMSIKELFDLINGEFGKELGIDQVGKEKP